MALYYPYNIDKWINGRKASLEGYVAESISEYLPNWLEFQVGEKNAEHISSVIRNRCSRYAILKSFHVDREIRGRGLGANLLDQAIEELFDADAFLLVCDSNENQSAGFSLQEFYERRGFEVVLSTPAGPLMVLPESLAEEIRQVLVDSGVKNSTN